MSLTPRSRFFLLMFGLALTVCVSGLTLASPTGDPDYETVVSNPSPLPTVSAAPTDPPGFDGSPLVVPAKATGPRQRFVLHDGTVLVGQVLAFDGQMYALRLPHSTLLVRKDFCKSVGPVAAAVSPKHLRPHPLPALAARVVSGARL